MLAIGESDLGVSLLTDGNYGVCLKCVLQWCCLFGVVIIEGGGKGEGVVRQGSKKKRGCRPVRRWVCFTGECGRINRSIGVSLSWWCCGSGEPESVMGRSRVTTGGLKKTGDNKE